jgi:hypothetical protein
MNKPAIDDLLSTTLYSWYSDVAQWMPQSPESTEPCEDCHADLAPIVDVQAWPHELMDGLAAAIEGIVRHVALSFQEDGDDDAVASVRAREIVMAGVAARASDVRDVLEQCVVYRLQAYQELDFDLARL